MELAIQEKKTFHLDLVLSEDEMQDLYDALSYNLGYTDTANLTLWLESLRTSLENRLYLKDEKRP